MLSHFNTEQMDQYFHQVNRSLGKMPQQERAELHSELRQHLDGLIDAYQELGLPPEEALRAALRRFGEPKKIGRRMYWEWHRGQRCGLSGEMKAVLSMLSLLAATAVLLPLLIFGLLWIPYYLWHWAPEVEYLDGLFLVGGPALAGGILGRTHPKHAVRGAFFAIFALTILPWLLSWLSWTPDFSPFEQVSVWAGCWLVSGCTAAFLGSRRRGPQGQSLLSALRLRRR